MGGIRPYYERDGITIFCGDCLEVMPQLDMVFDAIIADLPYGTTACSWDEVIPFEPLWTNYKRLVKKTGAVVLFGSQPFTSKLVMSNLEWFKYEWIWNKISKTDVMNVKNKPLKQHENIMIFSESTTANGSANKMVYYPQGVKSGTRKCLQTETNSGQAMNPRRKSHTLGYYQSQGENYPSSIVSFSNADRSRPLHPTQKPVDLLAYLIRTYTNPGEIILDNTAGSFTTAVACIKEGRRFVGIEKEDEYCRIGKERIVERLRQPTFFSIPNQPKTEKPKQLTLLEGAT